MISDEHKVIFVHLRRTGGNSIEMALGGIQLIDKDGKPTSTWDNNLHRGPNNPYKIDSRGHYMHDTALAIKERFPSKFESYRKFSVVRNPWDQMVSIYCRSQEVGKFKGSFKEFLVNYKSFRGTVPRYSLFGERGDFLIDEVARFENLDLDTKRICSDFGISLPLLPQSNPSKKSHYSNYYSKETREIVAAMFREDIRYFDYKF